MGGPTRMNCCECYEWERLIHSKNILSFELNLHLRPQNKIYAPKKILRAKIMFTSLIKIYSAAQKQKCVWHKSFRLEFNQNTQYYISQEPSGFPIH